MSEVEAWRHMDSISEPLREVRVVDLTFLISVVIYHELQKVIVVQISFITEVFQNVFDGDVPIIVSI